MVVPACAAELVAAQGVEIACVRVTKVEWVGLTGLWDDLGLAMHVLVSAGMVSSRSATLRIVARTVVTDEARRAFGEAVLLGREVKLHPSGGVAAAGSN